MKNFGKCIIFSAPSGSGKTTLVRELLKKIWDGYNIKNIDVEKFILALKKDKKNIGNDLHLILCKGYGNVFKVQQKVDDNFVSWLNEYFKFELK